MCGCEACLWDGLVCEGCQERGVRGISYTYTRQSYIVMELGFLNDGSNLGPSLSERLTLPPSRASNKPTAHSAPNSNSVDLSIWLGVSVFTVSTKNGGVGRREGVLGFIPLL